MEASNIRICGQDIDLLKIPTEEQTADSNSFLHAAIKSVQARIGSLKTFEGVAQVLLDTHIALERLSKKAGFKGFSPEGSSLQIGLDGRSVTYIHDELLLLLGYSREEISSLSFDELLAIPSNTLQRTISGGRPWEGDLYFRKKGDGYIRIWIESTPVRDTKGGITRFSIAHKELEGDHTMNEIFSPEEDITLIRQIEFALENDLIVPFFQEIVPLHAEGTSEKGGNSMVFSSTEARRSGSHFEGGAEEIARSSHFAEVPRKYEALVRAYIGIDKRSFISPDFLLTLAHRMGKYSVITECMIEKSFSFMKTHHCQCAINIEDYDLENPDFFGLVEKNIQKYNLAPNQVIFEIVESIIALNDKAFNLFERLKGLGCKISIDDFGTGYTNFNRLCALSPDFAKIDKSVLYDLCNTEDTRAGEKRREVAQKLIQGIVYMSNLGEQKSQVIVEGVETEEQANVLRKLGVHYAQGFYFSRPKPITEISL